MYWRNHCGGFESGVYTTWKGLSAPIVTYIVVIKGVILLKQKRMVMLAIIGGCFLASGGYSMFRKHAEKTCYLGLVYAVNGESNAGTSDMLLKHFAPFYGYINEQMPTESEVEDELTYEMILAQQAEDEDVVAEDLNEEMAETTTPVNKDLSLDKMRDFNYLLSKFYTVDPTTTIGAEQLNVDKLLSKDMKIDTKADGPKVLIFHTHSQETFANSREGDASTSIVGMGRYLSEILNAKGIETLHHDGVYDLIDGKLDRSNAYQMAEIGVKDILNQYPSIEVVIDLHRDGVPEKTHLVSEINGKQTAKIMFFNGLSRTRNNGEITYLPNPYIQDNLSFSFQMQLACEEKYPGLARRIYLKAYRYSLHMMPKSLLIEAGAQTNTVEEVKNAMEILANILVEVLL